eukprot:TRINITY_DN76_c0_g3_i1.p1 TRINITY_DN76_c0_g3~~TRINITY_DN76_c0_g3_i1.p1  ORF type:complete len:170 (-),score=77.80 TRINITY_DN76_c0_g3_i1:390-899(-)
MSSCRQNFSEVTEAAVNRHINVELTASYIYMSIAAYFDRDGVSLPGFKKFFKHQSDEEREHAQKLIDYVNQRGGSVTFDAISKPPIQVDSALKSLELALDLEKDVNAKLLALHKVADEQGDVHFCDYLEANFLNEQVESLREISDLITKLRRCGSEGLGLYLFDKDISC